MLKEGLMIGFHKVPFACTTTSGCKCADRCRLTTNMTAESGCTFAYGGRMVYYFYLPRFDFFYWAASANVNIDGLR